MICYISAGNSDNKLTQGEWFAYQNELVKLAESYAKEIFGLFFSEPRSPYQNMCLSLLFGEEQRAEINAALSRIRKRFQQTSIAVVWAERAELI